MKDHELEVRDLSKIYKTDAGEVHALRGIDLRVPPGETLVLLGPSGSGKSTLLNVLGGLDHATSGSARFHDFELTRSNDAELTRYRRASVGFIFQFFNLVPSLTARENVALITEIARDPMTPEEALARVGLSDRLDHFPAQLSGGQQQRVAVARAIAKRPQLLLCDEPTGSLDSEAPGDHRDGDPGARPSSACGSRLGRCTRRSPHARLKCAASARRRTRLHRRSG